jgi:hypothetical protein
MGRLRHIAMGIRPWLRRDNAVLPSLMRRWQFLRFFSCATLVWFWSQTAPHVSVVAAIGEHCASEFASTARFGRKYDSNPCKV